MRHFTYTLCASLLLLAGCDTINSATDSVTSIFEDAPQERVAEANAEEKTARSDNRIDIMADDSAISITTNALTGATLSAPQPVSAWRQENGSPAGYIGHLQTATLERITQSAEAGYGNDWVDGAQPPSPVVSAEHVFAMDGEGIVTAHRRDDLDEIAWKFSALKSDTPLLVGGLALQGKVLFALTGQGSMAAINTLSGKQMWRADIGQPVRSSLRYADKSLYIITADNRLQRFDAATGKLQWQHRGVTAETVIFGATLPAIYDDRIFVTYGSGEMFMLRTHNGETIWTDMLERPRRTLATGMFSGVDANPVLTNSLAWAASTNGLSIVNAAQDGRRIWALPTGAQHSPWIDDTIIWMITEDARLAAINSYSGAIGWLNPLPLADQDDDTSRPRLFGPYLINNTVIVLGSDGLLAQYDAISGQTIRTIELLDGIAASPAFVENAAYIITQDATLHEVR